MSGTPAITLQSVTGVDVELRVAGAGSRSYAFVIDWHIRLVLALAWVFVFAFLFGSQWNPFGLDLTGRWLAEIGYLPAALIYLLYHPVLEIATRGRTPGKRMAGVRIVSRTGDIPGAGALLLRNVFRLIDSLPFTYLLGLGVVMFTRQHVRIGDLAAGTLLVHDDAGETESLGRLRDGATNSRLSLQSVDLIVELLDRWSALDDARRSAIARSLIARVDPSVDLQTLLVEQPPQLRARLQALVAERAPA
jgi:uncharacterized RDD family membrane protein YckC